MKLHYQTQLYFYKYFDQWIIGGDPNTNVGLGYLVDSSNTPHQISSTTNRYWNILQNGKWVSNITAHIISSYNNNTNNNNGQNKIESIYKKFRKVKSLQYPTKIQSHLPLLPKLPKQQQQRLRAFRKLSNGLNIPIIGLGTGGIATHKLPSTLQYSLSIGYQLYDLAREYRNEHIIGRLLTDIDVIPSFIGYRKNMFLVSKVWPTHLGYQQTINQVIYSLNELRTTYIDLFFIHWPQ